MAKIHNLGFPRIGPNRELKQSLESYWSGDIDASELDKQTETLRLNNLKAQENLDYVPVGDFSLYDHILDTSFLLGNIPLRFREQGISELDQYFLAARGASDQSNCCAAASEMTKWFDTNYHYIVPEINTNTSFALNSKKLLDEVRQARAQGFEPKPVVVGPLSYLYLASSTDQTDKLQHLDTLIPLYIKLFNQLAANGVEWVQVDEPILATDLCGQWKMAFKYTYEKLKQGNCKLLLTSYFGDLRDNLTTVAGLPVAGLHIDALANPEDADQLMATLAPDQVLSLGVIDGRNVWRAQTQALVEWLSPYAQQLGPRLWLAPNCSLLHVPYSVEAEQNLTHTLTHKLAFAVQKLDELVVLRSELNNPQINIKSPKQLHRNGHTGHNQALLDSDNSRYARRSTFVTRREAQRHKLQLPVLPTTTIGSFPQTSEIRRARAAFKQENLSASDYQDFIERQIRDCIEIQEELGLDVLVHGEAERNDMVEYFGNLLEGVAVTQFGWVQSYGSRCVKPPLIYNQVRRREAMTVAWARYAQSLTDKPVKGMLTGPVTLLNWSFVRNDIALNEVAEQLALAIREEVQDLERAGIRIIQVDEAALREGLPLREADKAQYMTWALNAFKLATAGVADDTQIHTHMCYSEFSDIIDEIIKMDADVITIETARSHLTLLEAFKSCGYPNDIGPGVYDIHSPACPSKAQISDLIHKLSNLLPLEALWINPDCGLKTRTWPEARAALSNMVEAAKACRQALVNNQIQDSEGSVTVTASPSL
ncbi:5-methyltetrahydropteroyltriglutamate--homocysteine S-methyltransferase [Alteromonas lipotrueiana]|uniref:5-methyltetrahydropteroyltriglutamate-- homocysteine S-methyltransferase n=1 Tax=Alteromonas lipotrueiana TaxID=2803815 RepID=UPI001C464E9F|nr:5-methyltetrahydropteroyltriglutamate--homocysteine S-methyltransferase [Alteromonas lipotrueiana]